MSDLALIQGGGENSRTPPHNPIAEQEVLGQAMLGKSVAGELLELGLSPQDFYKPAHEMIWAAICHLNAAGESTSPTSVAEELHRRGELARVGGPVYLSDSIAAPSSVGNADYYARIVQEYATLRRLISAGTRIVQLGYGGRGDGLDAVVNLAQAEMYAITESRLTDTYLPIGDILDGTFDEIEASGKHGEAMTGVPTGFVDLDRLTNGLHPGQLIVIAARPAMGKSCLGLDIARSAAIHHGMASVMFSLEMGRHEITTRLLSAETRTPLQNIRKGMLRESDWEKLARARSVVDAAPLYIDDSPNLNIATIRTRARRLKQQHDLKLIVIDYLQLMTSGKRVESRQQEVSEFSRSLKLLAKELQVPVVALSQLNRGPEQRPDKKPLMSDLRESGSIEQDADMVILLHREDAYEKESPRAGEADFIVAKHRNGPTDTITVAFQGHYSRFVDMATDKDPYEKIRQAS